MVMMNMTVLALLLLLPLLRECDCACPPVGDIELSSDAKTFDEDGSLTEQADTHVARLGDTVIFTCNIRDTDLAWIGSVVGMLSDAILFNSSVMPGDSGAEGQSRGGAVVATLTEATPAECRTSTLSVNTSGVALGTVACTNQATNPSVTNRLESTEPPPSPSNIIFSHDTCTSVGVEWTEPASSDLPVTNYTITVTNLDNGNDLPMITDTGNSINIPGLMIGVNYRVEIVSNDVIGPGDSATEDFVIDPLFPPMNVEYQLECRTSTQAEITWQLPIQGPLTPPPTAVRVCWRENEGVELCSPNLPPGTTMYTVTATPNSEYTVRVEIDNGCSTADSSLDDSFDAAVIQDVTVTAPDMGAVAFIMEFAQCVENTMNWDVEVSYEAISGACPGDSRTFDYPPADVIQIVVFNNVTCTRNYTYTVNVTDESGTQVGEVDTGMFDIILPLDCDPNVLGTVDSTTDFSCIGVLEGSISSASISNGVVCYNGTTSLESQALYICDDEYEVPEDAPNPRECQIDGLWSGSDITCVEITTPPTTSEDDADSGGLSTGAAVGISIAVTFFGAFVLGTLFGAAIVYIVAVKRLMKNRPEQPSTAHNVQGAPVYEEPELIARERKIDTAANVAYGHTRF